MNDPIAQVSQIRDRFLGILPGTTSSEEVDRLRVEFLGKKGILTGLLRGMGGLPPEERPRVGEAVNVLRDQIESALRGRLVRLRQVEEDAAEAADRVDVTLRGAGRRGGVPHPVAQTMREVIEIFVGMGFSVTSGPEAELDFFNFEALNFKPHHPARDMQDTFYLEGGRLLRTHTSPVEVRSMLDRGAPLRIICPGKVYRRDSDPTHSPMFHQLEGLLIDEDVSVADLKGCLDAFVGAIFGRPLRTRYRASYFPFTEPSLEVDVECVACGGSGDSGCRVCRGSGWLEILGCGMTHPNVLKAGGIDPDRYNGFAWGMGIDRVAMLKYGLTDLRPLFEGDLAFLEGRE
jgi:phenylalanyl-tRNA synthetase alpha chain